MLPNPFEKQLPEFKNTDPLKNCAGWSNNKASMTSSGPCQATSWDENFDLAID